MIGKRLLPTLFKWWSIWKLCRWRCALRCHARLLTTLTWWLQFRRLSALKLFCRPARLKLTLDLFSKTLSARTTRLSALIVLLLTLGLILKLLKRIANLRLLRLRSGISAPLMLGEIWVRLMHLFESSAVTYHRLVVYEPFTLP